MGDCLIVRRGGGSAIPPKPPTSWQFLQAFTQSGTFTPPQDGWYRIECFGKSGKGGDGGSGGNSSKTTHWSGSGGAAGNAGGYSCSFLKLKNSKPIAVTVTASVTSFGDMLSATAGGDGPNGVSKSEEKTAVSTVTGNGLGGNQTNQVGALGGYGGEGRYKSSVKSGNGASGGNDGGTGGTGGEYKNTACGGGGGGGARLSKLSEFVIQDTTTHYKMKGGNGSTSIYSEGGKASTIPQDIFVDNIPLLYGSGGGGGGGSGQYYLDTTKTNPGGKGSLGTPGCIIISKGVDTP